jgi:hypothetical protein
MNKIIKYKIYNIIQLNNKLIIMINIIKKYKWKKKNKINYKRNNKIKKNKINLENKIILLKMN